MPNSGVVYQDVDGKWTENESCQVESNLHYEIDRMPFQGQVHQEFVCGWGAAFINILATFPLNKLMFRQQLHGIPCWRAARQLREEGIINLYRGLLPPLIQKTTSVSMMFGLYDYFQVVIHRFDPSVTVPVAQGISALLA
ncbi:mitochondrial nicotinamide adenine dinucleotide transporter SLC25A51-like, partial [Saccoglossus kowalevskii]